MRSFSPPFPFLVILLIVILELIIWLVLEAEGGKLIFFLLVGTLIAGTVFLKSVYKSPRCSLFRGPSREGGREICGRQSRGSVRARYYEWGRFVKRREFFCSWHDPEKKSMQDWLREQGVEVDLGTIRKFETPQDEDNGPSLPY